MFSIIRKEVSPAQKPVMEELSDEQLSQVSGGHWSHHHWFHHHHWWHGHWAWRRVWREIWVPGCGCDC